ncbi:O-antigen ligase family protein [Empedobacter brevis]|uniref:O-antigen ligase family protein n=1 Tax=Empedobacter brevis TaxID=247 RepID=UPI00123DD56C|nr:O-antigen ligase family protein [Empedobacter brevis]QES92007.1 O-antigen ligase family protein [Empedobacter brevis]
MKSFSLDRIYRILFSLGLFFFSFNQIEVMPFLGEYIKESGAIFFLLGFMTLIYEILINGKIYLPYKSNLLKLIFIFYLLALVCTLLNFDTVTTNYFKRTSGITRFIRQYISLTIPIIIFLPFFWRVFKDMSLEDLFLFIRKILLYSLLFCSFYGFWEILYSYFNIFYAKYVLDFFSLFPLLKTMNHGGRISSFTYEPPALAIYLITISGWMFSYIITEKKIIKKITPTLLILILTFFSGSRTALLVITFVFFIFMFYLYMIKMYRKEIMIFSFSLITCSIFLFTMNSSKLVDMINEKVESLDFQANLKNNISNQTRFGMSMAMTETFKENPIFGVGFGQQVYHSRFHYPIWAKKNNWEFTQYYENKKDPTFPPGFNLYLRLLAELGLVGLISWLIIIIYSLKLSIRFIKHKNHIVNILATSILFSLIGLYINWFQIDSFRMYGVWIYIVILIKIDEELKHKNLA